MFLLFYHIKIYLFFKWSIADDKSKKNTHQWHRELKWRSGNIKCSAIEITLRYIYTFDESKSNHLGLL